MAFYTLASKELGWGQEASACPLLGEGSSPGDRPCRHRWWQVGHRLGRWRCWVPGSTQATPGEAESGGPQELLKPPHILDDPGRLAKEEKREG